MPRALWKSWGGLRFPVSEVPLYSSNSACSSNGRKHRRTVIRDLQSAQCVRMKGSTYGVGSLFIMSEVPLSTLLPREQSAYSELFFSPVAWPDFGVTGTPRPLNATIGENLD